MKLALSDAKRPGMKAVVHWMMVALACTAGVASAQTYPDKSRPIRVTVPTGPASAVDLLARAYAKAITDVSGVSVVVENKAGAEGVPGVQAFLQAPADGYNMLVVSSSLMSLNPVMIPKLAYDPLKDLVPVQGISQAGLIMNLGTSTTFKSAREFVASAKANPGKHTCASATTTTRMACEYLQAAAGIKLLNVPYKTTAAAMLAVASGEADTIFVDAGSSIAQWQTGRVRGVAVTSPDRLSTLAKLPTMREEGVTDFNMSAWYAAYVRADTPPNIISAMRGILREVAKRPEIAETLTKYSMDPLPMVGDDLTTMNRREIERWSKLVRDNNIKLAE
jgi:tripartite-type tricarboxylate transporter receptor subunit TctC